MVVTIARYGHAAGLTLWLEPCAATRLLLACINNQQPGCTCCNCFQPLHCPMLDQLVPDID
jgi:hypothetical protein